MFFLYVSEAFAPTSAAQYIEFLEHGNIFVFFLFFFGGGDNYTLRYLFERSHHRHEHKRAGDEASLGQEPFLVAVEMVRTQMTKIRNTTFLPKDSRRVTMAMYRNVPAEKPAMKPLMISVLSSVLELMPKPMATPIGATHV